MIRKPHCQMDFTLIHFLGLFHQVVGSGGHRSALLAGADVGIWSPLYQREHGYHGLPVHHLQRLPGHVHLHLPLCPVQKGNSLVRTFYSFYFMRLFSLT